MAKEVLKPAEQIFKNKLEAIEKARHFNPNDRKLLEIYLETLPNVLPSEEVVKIILGMIGKEQSSILLWENYLKNVCSTCNITAESGLKEHEKAINQIRKINDSDVQMIQLFKMSSLFLRQAGLEQFFALIHLMMSININAEVDGIFYAANECQNPHLMEFEELVLQCNLPMPELWFRTETLRSICNFLPVKIPPTGSDKMEDPQRYVFNEDICNLVNPLRNQKAYSFDLFLIILKLFKYPMPHYKNFQDIEIFNNYDREIECGMNFLSILLVNMPPTCEIFNKVFYNVVKDINVSPNFLNFNIEFEPYLAVIMKLLETCSTAFTDHQNKIVLILWLRLQRLAVNIDALKMRAEQKSHGDAAEYTKYKKLIKTRVKNTLKSSKYQNDLSIYREYALIELSLGDDKSCFNILNMAIDAAKTDDEAIFYQILIEFCEQKLMRNEDEECLKKLKGLTDGNVLEFLSTKILEVSDDTCDEVEDFFLPKSLKLDLMKAKVLFLLLTRSKQIALKEILLQINSLKLKEGSHTREKLYEFYVWTFHQKIHDDEALNHRQYMETLSKALHEYPKNIFIMHTIASQSSLRWFDIRKLLLKTPTNESIFYLLIASKLCEERIIAEDDSKIYQHRIFNTIDGLMSRSTSGISSILTWRLYLRAAFNYDFSKCRRILYEALDKYPMVKSFYLDGSRYLSEDLSQLHDLIIEKGIRIHSLIEELEILRSTTST